MSVFFSIVIPTYNRKHLIRNTIESCMAQDFKDYEIQVIDDGSTDGTFDFLTKSYSEIDTIRVHRISNGERGRARNFGFNESEGEYIVFLDSDDELQPHALKIFHSYLTGNPNTRFLAGKYYLNHENGKEEGPLSGLSAGLYGREVLLKGNPFACNIVVRKDNPDLIPFQEDRRFSSMEDWLFLLENTGNSAICIIDDFTVTMNDHAGRSMRADHEAVIEARIEATRHTMTLLDLDRAQTDVLQSYSCYFCAIHSYLGGMRKIGIKFCLKSIRKGGPKTKNFALFLKLLIGRNMILKLKGE